MSPKVAVVVACAYISSALRSLIPESFHNSNTFALQALTF